MPTDLTSGRTFRPARLALGLAALTLALVACGGSTPETNAALKSQAVTCAAWNAGTAYTAGDTVTAGGATYRANWWTQGDNPATNSGPAGSGKPWTPVSGACGAPTDPAPPPSSGIACFYADVNFGGASFCADADSGWVGTDWNDRISSLKVQSGYQVQLFNDINYGGTSKTFSGDVATVGSDFNDLASSFKVLKSSTPPPPNTGGYKRVAYFVQWGIYARNFKLANVESSGAAAGLTHINYAFGGISPDGTCTVTTPGKSDSFADYTKSFAAAESVDGVGDVWSQTLRGNFNQLKKLKAKHPGLKALISLGGWTWSKEFSDVALTDASRKKFVSSCVDLYINGNLPATDGAGGPGSGAGVFDGIDIDWEYPASEGNAGNIVRPEDTRNYTLLLEEFRRQLGSGKLLTAALPADPAKVAKLEVANIARTLDLMNLMTYDYRGAWNAQGPTNFHANLYPDPVSPGSAAEKVWSVDTTVGAYVQAGAPANKLVMGVPFYGRGWTGVNGAGNGLYQSAGGPAHGSVEPGIEDYKVLAGAPGTVYRNTTTKALWKFDGTTFWSYDDPQVLADKTAYIKSRGLGGAMAWSLDGDDAGATLGKALANGLK